MRERGGLKEKRAKSGDQQLVDMTLHYITLHDVHFFCLSAQNGYFCAHAMLLSEVNAFVDPLDTITKKVHTCSIVLQSKAILIKTH